MNCFKILYILRLSFFPLFFIQLPCSADTWSEIRWEALIPKGWDPAREFRSLDLSRMRDKDPRAMKALETLKQVLDNAPAEPTLNEKKIRISGFVLPLEREGEDGFTEFLLVPYFGACIHSPPPPANQIIYAKSSKPIPHLKIMEPIWVYGTLRLRKGSTQWGVSSYHLTVDKTARRD